MKPDTSVSIWQGKLVRLRAPESSDWETFWRWSHDDEHGRHLDYIYFPISRERQKYWAERGAMREQADDNCHLVIENNAGELVGGIDSHHCDRRVGHFQYGIAVARDYRQKGYASEAILLLLRYFFQELRYQKATVNVHSDNEGSIRLHERFGFLLEGRVRRALYANGQYLDEFYYGLTAEEFAEKHSHRFS